MIFRYAQELSTGPLGLEGILQRYHFRIDYWHDKANRNADALSHFPRSQRRSSSGNTQILYRLPSFVVYCQGPQPFPHSFYFDIKPETSAPSPPLQNVHCFVTSQAELADKRPCKVSIGGMRLRLQKVYTQRFLQGFLSPPPMLRYCLYERSTGYTPFELNCGYHPSVSYE